MGDRLAYSQDDLIIDKGVILFSFDHVYPDVSVAGDERDRTTSQFVTYPCLIFEVLSPATEAYDRGSKFRLYRRNPSLRDYILIDANEVAVEMYHKDENNKWDILNYQSGDMVELKSVNLSISIDQIYEDIVFES